MIETALEAAGQEKGAALTPAEIEHVIALLASWLDLLARGMSPAQVAAIVHAEATAPATIH